MHGHILCYVNNKPYNVEIMFPKKTNHTETLNLVLPFYVPNYDGVNYFTEQIKTDYIPH